MFEKPTVKFQEVFPASKQLVQPKHDYFIETYNPDGIRELNEAKRDGIALSSTEKPKAKQNQNPS